MLKNCRQLNYKIRWKTAQKMYPLYQQVEEGKLCCGAECGSMFPEDDGKQSLVVN